MRHISFQRHTLANGLRLLVHEDATTPLVTVNIVYHVGSRDEVRPYTGIAHLLEHVMFTGSKNVDNYDFHLQKIGGINNAYTSQDITNYYVTLPAQNIETALWLESDRMVDLAFHEKGFTTQKSVVIEEFKENFLNVPYGSMGLHFNDFLFEKHPYKWLPIGFELSDVENIDLETLKAFYRRYYHPNNAVMSIAGNISFEKAVALVEKWFGSIPAGEKVTKNFPKEMPQLQPKFKKIEADVPYPIVLKGWRMCDRKDPLFYAYDLLSDMMGNGQSSFLFQEFVLKQKLFTDINAYISGTFDEGALVMLARPQQGVNLEEASEKMSQYLKGMVNQDVDYALQKVKNNVTSLILKNSIKAEDRATTLAVSETLSCVEDFENEIEAYHAVTKEQIKGLFERLWKDDLAMTMFYGS